MTYFFKRIFNHASVPVEGQLSADEAIQLLRNYRSNPKETVGGERGGGGAGEEEEGRGRRRRREGGGGGGGGGLGVFVWLIRRCLLSF